MKEIWKDVVGHEGFYKVSNIGRIKRIKRGKGALLGKTRRPQKQKMDICKWFFF
jgi:hypothetical protein